MEFFGDQDPKGFSQIILFEETVEQLFFCGTSDNMINSQKEQVVIAWYRKRFRR